MEMRSFEYTSNLSAFTSDTYTSNTDLLELVIE